MINFHRALIAGTHSGVGKTTWSLALMAYFRKMGLQVQPFKVGPDYIDPTFHNQVCYPRKSRNLDRYFLRREYIQRSYAKHSEGVDLVLIEGVMGLYDGCDFLSDEGSTAEIAKILSVPVFLVIDATGLSRSAAAIVKGYRSFDLRVNVAGVFVNRAGGEGHFKLLQKAIEKEGGVPVLGWLPEDLTLAIPERYLGLRTALEEEWLDAKLQRLVAFLESRFDSKRFLQLSRAVKAYAFLKFNPSSSTLSPKEREQGEEKSMCRIGVAYDKAFSFYYEDNLDLLRRAGAEIVFFSPLTDAVLPQHLDALYFGGGFPELYVETLSKNESMRVSIRKFYHEGGVIYAECGGMIYLTQFFVDSEERKFPMVGLVPGRIRMTERLQNFGYHEIEATISTFLFPHGKKLRSHEFHYSTWEAVKNFQAPYCIGERTDGFYDGRLLASYQHLHFGQDVELARSFVRAAVQASRNKPVRTEKEEKCAVS